MLLLFSSLKMFPGRKIFKLMWIKRLNKYYRRLFIRCELHCFHTDTVRCAHRLPSIAASQRTETQNECWAFPFNILIRWCSDVQLFKLTTSYGIRMRHQHHHHKMNSENFQASNWVLTAKFCLIYCLTVLCVCLRFATFELRITHALTYTHSVDTLNESFELLMTGIHRGTEPIQIRMGWKSWQMEGQKFN